MRVFRLCPRGDNAPQSSGLRAQGGVGERRGREWSRAGALAVAIHSPIPALAAGTLAKHDRGDFAQEFLRRNAAYRAAWTAARDALRASEQAESWDLAQPWGLVRMFDPDRAVRSAPALWRANCASQIVSLAPAPAGFAGGAALPDVAFLTDFAAPDGRHVVLDLGGMRHRLHVLTDAPAAPLAVLLPPLGDTLRAAACDAARRMFAGLSVAEPASALRPSALQRQRLALLLRVLDASLAGMSNREIGVRIVYPWLTGTAALAWKSMSERRRVQRLVTEACDLAGCGYRALLRA